MTNSHNKGGEKKHSCNEPLCNGVILRELGDRTYCEYLKHESEILRSYKE